MTTLRVVGDVHGQLAEEDVCKRGARSYLDILRDAEYSVQVGDMGDAETYEGLTRAVDAARHRFFPGNHDHHPWLPEHCLGDWGERELGGVRFFFVRGAASSDKQKLQRLGAELGKLLWYEEEELTDHQMEEAAAAYRAAAPAVVFSHDAPASVATLARRHAAQRRRCDPESEHAPESRTQRFLQSLHEAHPAKLWVFGHYHHDWRYRSGPTQFVCVGELSFIDVTPRGEVVGPS